IGKLGVRIHCNQPVFALKRSSVVYVYPLPWSSRFWPGLIHLTWADLVGLACITMFSCNQDVCIDLWPPTIASCELFHPSGAKVSLMKMIHDLLLKRCRHDH